MFITVPVDKISPIIGKWWENIQRIEKTYDVKISIEDDGKTTIVAVNQEWWEKAIAEINEVLWEPDVGYKWVWKVVKIIDWTGAIVEFRGKTWMIHISKLTWKRIMKVEEVVKMWDEVKFEIIQIDTERGKIGLKREWTEAELKEFNEAKAKRDAEGTKPKTEEEKK
jgi:polyribonucleotide nucleotidyltransferase